MLDGCSEHCEHGDTHVRYLYLLLPPCGADGAVASGPEASILEQIHSTERDLLRVCTSKCKSSVQLISDFVSCGSDYLIDVAGVPLHHLKFMDETSIDYRKLHRSYGYSVRGRRLHVTRGWFPAGPNYTMSVMTSLSAPGGFICSTPRTVSNTSYDFLLFLVEVARAGHLKAGDVLVLDNASVHNSELIARRLQLFLVITGVRLLFLPTYSPELNPCELLFAMMKNEMRRIRDTHHNMLNDVVTALAKIRTDNVVNFYDHCLHRFDE